jgi:hypothetical protein
MLHSRRSVFTAMMLAALLPLVMAISGCAGTRSAYAEADSVDEYAYVLTEHYASLVNQSANIAALPTTTQATKDALKRAAAAALPFVKGDATAVPRVPGLAELAGTYKQIRSAENEAALQKAINNAVIKVADLVRAVKAAGGK